MQLPVIGQIGVFRGHWVSPQKYKEGKKNSRKQTEKEGKTSNVFEQLEGIFLSRNIVVGDGFLSVVGIVIGSHAV